MTETQATAERRDERRAVRLAVGLPAGWMRVPRFATDGSGDEAIASWATDVARANHDDPIRRARLGVALATLARRQRVGVRAASAAAVLVSVGAPATTSVCAVAFVETVARPVANRELPAVEAADACRVVLDDAARFAPSGDALGVRQRQVARGEIAGDPAITVHELLAVRGAGDVRTLQRRVVQFRFPDAPWVFVVTATSPRLVLDPPLDAASHAIAASIRMEPTS